MKFEEFEQEDILKLFNVITNEVDHMFFMVDQAFRIQYINRAFSNYVKRDINDIIDREFGEALGCVNMHKDNRNCAFTSYCSTCEIRKNFHRLFSGMEKIIEFDLVREFKIADEFLVKHYMFKIISLRLHDTDFALCLMSDKRKQDDLAMLINPNESI